MKNRKLKSNSQCYSGPFYFWAINFSRPYPWPLKKKWTQNSELLPGFRDPPFDVVLVVNRKRLKIVQNTFSFAK